MALHYGTGIVPDFATLVERFPKGALASPMRSTVPLLDFWRPSEDRLPSFCKAVGIERLQTADLFFEFPVAVRWGHGKPSFTDLMVLGEHLAMAVEAKFTEPRYQDVRAWLGDRPTANRTAVLEGWLDLIRTATSRRVERADVLDLPYQLLHRTASVCSLDRQRRLVIYQWFGTTPPSHYAEVLSELSRLAGVSGTQDFKFVAVTVAPSRESGRIKARWRSHEAGIEDAVRSALVKGPLSSFQSPTPEPDLLRSRTGPARTGSRDLPSASVLPTGCHSRWPTFNLSAIATPVGVAWLAGRVSREGNRFR